MKTSLKTLFIFCLFFSLSNSSILGQQAVGDWKYHLNYTDGEQIVGSENESLFVLNPHSLYYFSGPNQELDELDRTDGLSTQNLRSLYFDNTKNQLLLAHQNGIIDFISEEDIIPFFGIRDSEFISEKTLAGFSSQGNQVWVSGSFGFAELDLQNQILKDTYLNLGENGETLQVNSVASNTGIIFIGTTKGIRYAALSSNLKDFRSWQTIPGSEEFLWKTLIIDGPAQWALNENGALIEFSVTGIDEIAGINGAKNLKSIDGEVFFQMDNQIFNLEENGNFRQIAEAEDKILDFWVSESVIHFLLENKGILLSNQAEGLLPNGPDSKSNGLGHLNGNPISLSTRYDIDQGVISSSSARSSEFDYSIWEELSAPDSVTVSISWNGENYWGTPNGLWKSTAEGLEKVSLPDGQDNLPISSFTSDALGNLWIGVFDQESRLLKINSEGISSVPVPGLLLSKKLISDLQSRIWIIQGNRFGRTLRLFDPESGRSQSFGSASNQGGLPDNRVNDIFLDDSDRLWMGTDRGIAFFPSAPLVDEGSNIQALLPLINNRPVLAGDRVNTIQQLADETFFVGTNSSGLWHFDVNFEAIKANYTFENSPIPSNQILSLLDFSKGGELFILAPEGIISLRTGIKESFPELDELKIFPNPVTDQFDGILTIEGLVDGVDVIITDTAGNAVFRAFTQGGSLTWNLQDGNGARLKTGVYLVYVLDSNGNQRARGKFLVI
ncbi:two-component regulator propeller domain-containing protein [Algoriphagus sediminis]|uniref:Two-component regulator propeller domain-containing protein n=1 Tax=Algoriphagus sediminis TaxID=3057113 RepID=A0ABT7YE96_9BACT|nr:two-component regulator propeller domain-containing protein [Algoriphagus sediminis]MDN3204844.1 two-component regulator propeller domain-containing protein [Algoriphagus sediminis]